MEEGTTKLYEKACHQCGGKFFHASRNTKYCGEKCQEASKKVNHSRKRRRKDYAKNAVDRRAQSMSRKQAREFCIATHALSNCTACGKMLPIADLEDHHRDGDPFNNTKDNLTLVCHGCHAKADTAWRKEKDAGLPIADMRKFTQVGILMMDTDGKVFVVLPTGTKELVG